VTNSDKVCWSVGCCVKTVNKHTDTQTLNKYISSRRWDPRDDACHAQSTIALYTELHAGPMLPGSTVSNRCRLYTTHAASPPGAVNTRPPVVAVYIALADSRRAVAKFSLIQGLGQSSRGQDPYFWRYPNFPRTQRSEDRGKPVCKKISSMRADRHTRWQLISALA